MNENEFNDFLDIVRSICLKDRNILGVLAIGSLVQNLRLPLVDNDVLVNDKVKAYELIRNRSRRRLFPSQNSDLDLWVCTESDMDNQKIIETLESRAMELISWLSQNLDKHFTLEWVEKKQKAFNDFYKQLYLYTESWNQKNFNRPWDANVLKTEIINELIYWLPDVVKRVNFYFNKKIPGSFFEVRAYPQSTFNLRPEDIIAEGVEDRSPFPRIMDSDWIDLNKNCLVLYSSQDAIDNLIYPFNPNGERLGRNIKEYIES